MRFGLVAIILLQSTYLAGPANADANILCVQQALAARGLNPGALDGELGAQTRAVAQSAAAAQRLTLPTLTLATAGAWCQALRSPATTSSVGSTFVNPQRPRLCPRYVVDPDDPCY